MALETMLLHYGMQTSWGVYATGTYREELNRITKAISITYSTQDLSPKFSQKQNSGSKVESLTGWQEDQTNSGGGKSIPKRVEWAKRYWLVLSGLKKQGWREG